MKNTGDDQLRAQRERIDAIDARLLQLVNERIAIAREIASIKERLQEPAYYRPEREAQVLRRLKALNEGPMHDEELEQLFREIMSITRGAEARLSVAVLGPEGTYSEAAALRHFGASVHLRPCATISEVFRTVETERADFAVVPLENSTEGGVSDTLDKLVTTPLKVAGEINLKIHHNLLGGASRVQEVRRVLAHSQSIAQCREWLDRHLPEAEQIHVASNAEASRRVRGDAQAAAIAGDAAAEHYGLHRLAANIEDEPGNTTRFLVMSWRETPASGRDKTSLLLSCRNRPGALYHLLKPLADHEISMTRIESRPSRMGLWDYIFFVDIEGHQEEKGIATALAELSREAGLFKNLGSYPAAT